MDAIFIVREDMSHVKQSLNKASVGSLPNKYNQNVAKIKF